MSAATPAPGESRQQLGELLVRHRVVTPEQLAVALERQRATRQPLGRVIVELGFAPGPIVAQALATQRGGLVKTEYGFATGWLRRRDTAAAAGAERERTIAELREWMTHARTAIAARDEAIGQLKAMLSSNADELARLSADLEAAHAQIELERRQAVDRRTRSRRLVLVGIAGSILGAALFGVSGAVLGATVCYAISHRFS